MHVPRTRRKWIKDVQAAAQTLSDVLGHSELMEDRTHQLPSVEQSLATAAGEYCGAVLEQLGSAPAAGFAM